MFMFDLYRSLLFWFKFFEHISHTQAAPIAQDLCFRFEIPDYFKPPAITTPLDLSHGGVASWALKLAVFEHDQQGVATSSEKSNVMKLVSHFTSTMKNGDKEDLLKLVPICAILSTNRWVLILIEK